MPEESRKNNVIIMPTEAGVTTRDSDGNDVL